MGSLPTPLFIGNRWSGCLHALVNVRGIAPFTRLFRPLSIVTPETLMYCVLFVRIGVLPPTPSTLYLESCQSLCRTYTVLVGFQSMGGFMMRPSLALKSSVTKISRPKGDSIFMRVFICHIAVPGEGIQSK